MRVRITCNTSNLLKAEISDQLLLLKTVDDAEKAEDAQHRGKKIYKHLKEKQNNRNGSTGEK